MILIIKYIAFLIILYPVVVIMTLISEVAYGKRTISEIKDNAKSLIKRTTAIYILLVVSSIIYVIWKYE